MDASISSGTRIGRYEIQSKLGAGGMGEVYLAEDTQLGRRVALKLLPENLTGNKERLSRFKQEARAASTLNHPNILTLHEIGQEGSVYFIATEFIDGLTLRRDMKGSPRKIAEVLEMSRQSYVSPHDMAILYTGLGDKERALEQLERAYQERNAWMMFLKVEPVFDPLRSDPRFADLLRRMGFAP